jgi:hypothetical protein
MLKNLKTILTNHSTIIKIFKKLNLLLRNFFILFVTFFIFVFFPPQSYADFTISNLTDGYLKLYITTTATCLPAVIYPGEQTSLLRHDSYQFCSFKNPCFGYIYKVDKVNDTSKCNGEFLGIFSIDIKQQLFADLTAISPNYKFTGIGTSFMEVTSLN